MQEVVASRSCRGKGKRVSGVNRLKYDTFASLLYDRRFQSGDDGLA